MSRLTKDELRRYTAVLEAVRAIDADDTGTLSAEKQRKGKDKKHTPPPTRDIEPFLLTLAEQVGYDDLHAKRVVGLMVRYIGERTAWEEVVDACTLVDWEWVDPSESTDPVSLSPSKPMQTSWRGRRG